MYIDAYEDREHHVIRVVGRDAAGQRFFHEHAADYSFYHADRAGRYLGMQGEPLTKVVCSSYKNMTRAVAELGNRPCYEQDIKPVFKCLEQHYAAAGMPDLHVAALDIEVDFSKSRGFAPPEDPHQPITAISLDMSWCNTLITLVLLPTDVDVHVGQDIAVKFPDCVLFTQESALLQAFYALLDDVDVLTTWNGETFDIPYIVNRTTRVLGAGATRGLCLWGLAPKKKTFARFGKEQTTYEIFGRVHLDYYQLYRKYTYHEQPSYRLDYIGEIELGENKVQYAGTLDQLYHEDFEKFIAYNRQDVALLTKLENKLRFVALTNVLAHESCVLFATTLGAVGLTDQAIVLEAHARGMQVPSKDRNMATVASIAGAYVVEPAAGLHEWIGTVDITSLYPSIIRALNMSPECLVGQIRQDLTAAHQAALRTSPASCSHEDDDDSDDDDADHDGAAAWAGLFACLEYDAVMQRSDCKLILDLASGESMELTAAEIHDWVFAPDSGINLTANATIFKTTVQGVVPGLLSRWFSDRMVMQQHATDYDKLADGWAIDAQLAEQLSKYHAQASSS